MASSIPPRVRWAVDLVDPRPDDEVLEVGGGTAASASLVCARLQGGHLTALELPEASIDKAFSLNVNVFWTSPASRELTMLARVLRPGGLLALVWSGAPTASGSSTARVLGPVSAAVAAGPFTDITIHDTPSGCGVVARRS